MDEFTRLNDVLNRYGRSSEDGAPRRIAEAFRGFNERIKALAQRTGEGSDKDGYVTATVRATGLVESVYISPDATRRLPGEALGDACVAAIVAARRASALAMASGLAELTGQRVDLDEMR